MHLIVPFAGVLGDEAAAVRNDLELPHLAALLQRLAVVAHDRGDEASYSPPHERALARALGLPVADGLIPWAAHHARTDLRSADGLAWGEFTPAHGAIGRDSIRLADPAALELGEADSRELFEALRPLWVDEGYLFEYVSPLRWLAAHESLGSLRCASPDRAIGRALDQWVPEGPHARRVRRLQSEAQMLLYQHPQHDRRLADGRLPVNTVWLSGCGAGPPAGSGAAAAGAVVGTAAAGEAAAGDAAHAAHATADPVPQLRLDDRLRAPALAADWAGWAEAWRTLDAQTLREALDRARDGLPVKVVLCGERSAVTLAVPAGGAWLERLRRRLSAPAPARLLEDL
jgi:hypothetical protein